MKEGDFEPPWPELDLQPRRVLQFGLRRLSEAISQAKAEGKLSPTGPLQIRLLKTDGSDVEPGSVAADINARLEAQPTVPGSDCRKRGRC